MSTAENFVGPVQPTQTAQAAAPATKPTTPATSPITGDQMMATATAVVQNPTVRKTFRMTLMTLLIGLAIVGGVALWGGAVRFQGTTMHVANLGYESELVTMVNAERAKSAQLQKDLEQAQKSFWSKLKFW